jgi:hypothetical protein
MMRAVPLLLCTFSARVAAQAPGHLRGANVRDCPNDVCTDHGYTGYDHKNSDGGDQWTVPVDNNDWWQCAEACSHSVACQGWTLVYNGQCYLKETLSSEDPNQWRHDQNVISGLRKASLQLQVQSESCPNDVCTDHGYTGYDHRNSDGGDQWTVPVDNNEWWQCADACSHSAGCNGWTLVYNGACYLKGTLSSEDPNQWRHDQNVISGF